jgi:hypothetical protein
MSTLVKLIVFVVAWQTGLLSWALMFVGGLIMWTGAVLQQGMF